MAEQELVDYIQQAQKHGLSDFEIKQNLLNVGWDAALVEENFVFARAAENKIALGDSPFNPAAKLPSHPSHSPLEATTPGFSLPVHSLPIANTQTPALHPNMQSAIPPITVTTFSTPFYKKPALWLTIILLLLLAGSAYGYYNYVYITPARIWASYIKTQKSKTYSLNYSYTYSDSGSSYATSSPPAAVSVSLSGTAASDYSDPNNGKMNANSVFALQYGPIGYNIKFSYLLIGSVVYFDVSQINQLKGLLPGNDVQWLKLDLNELQKYANQNQNDFGTQLPQINTDQLKTKLAAIWSKPDFIQPTSFLARENLNGVGVYHLKNQLNDSGINSAIINSLEAISSTEPSSTPITGQDKAIITTLLNKFKIKNFDVWIGQKDSQIYKIQLAIAAPGISDFTNAASLNTLGPLGSAQEKSRDAKRLADIRQMASALELYYNDYNGYPEGLKGGAPNLSPMYIGLFPSAPTPADGSCTDYYNGYWYKHSGKAKTVKGQTVYPSYSLTFCLGNDTGGYKAGIGMLSPSGIKDNITCPSTSDLCFNNSPPASQESQITDQIKKMSFSGQISFEGTYADFNKPQSIQAPATSTDLIDLIKGTIGQTMTVSQDAKRIADIRQFASALELYFNDKNSYPSSLDQLTPSYLGLVPTAPTPPGGNCSEAENTYTYKLVNSTSYQLNFCLGSQTGGYSAGAHALSQAGIQ